MASELTPRNALSAVLSTTGWVSFYQELNANFDKIDAALALCNWEGGAVDPTTTNDVTEGYSIGSIWWTNTAKWECQDATENAAVWVQTWPAATSNPTSPFEIVSADNASYLRLKGLGDADNYAALELWKGDGTNKWQFCHRKVAGETGDFAFAHYNGATWIFPLALTNAGLIKTTGEIALAQIATPSAPAASLTAIYSKAGGGVYRRANGGSEVDMGDHGAMGGLADDDHTGYATNTNHKVRHIQFMINGGGAAILTGICNTVRIGFACTIKKVTLLAKPAGAIVVDIWKSTYTAFDGGATHPVDGDSITSATPPTIAATNAKSKDATLTNWTTAIAADDVLMFNVDSCTTIQQCTVDIEVEVTR